MLIRGDTCRDCPRVCEVIATWVPLRILLQSNLVRTWPGRFSVTSNDIDKRVVCACRTFVCRLFNPSSPKSWFLYESNE